MSPLIDVGETEVTVTQPRRDAKPGRLLETILDESTVTTPPSSDQGKHSKEPSPHADLSWSDIKYTPMSLKTSLFQESPPERAPLSERLDTVLSYTDVKHTPGVVTNEAFGELVSLNHSFMEPTPKSVKKSLFEDSVKPGNNLQNHHQVTPSHQVQERPESAEDPQSTGLSPQLDFWLLPQNGNLNYSGVKATPNSVRTELFEGTPLENGNSPFSGLGFLSKNGEQFTTPAEKTSQADPLHFDLLDTFSPSAIQATPLRSPLARHTTPEIRAVNSDHELDTRELAERLNRIKQPSLQPKTWGLQPNLSSNHSATKQTLIGETPSRHINGTRETDYDSYPTQSSPSFSQQSRVRGLTPQDGIPFEQTEIAVTPSVTHPTSKPVSSLSNEVDTSALIQRLNKIKLTQQSFSTPHFSPLKPPEARTPESMSRKENVVDAASDTSLLASRLDQIKQAQKSQQVTLRALVLL